MQKSTHGLPWDDLRTLLAIARGGGLSGAARALGVEHSTVFRRLREVEARVGFPLFERGPRGYVARPEAEPLLDAATDMEAAALRAERRLLGRDDRASGVVRLATSELLAAFLLPSVLSLLVARHPGICVEVTVSDDAVDLTRRDADLALRATMAPPEHLVGRVVGTVGYGIFGARSRFGGVSTPSPIDLARLPWLGFDDRLARMPMARWFNDTLPEAHRVARFDSNVSLLHAAAAGLGLCVAPLFAGAQVANLLQLGPTLPATPMTLWVLRHAEVAPAARVRVVTDHLVEHVGPAVAAIVSEGARSPAEVLMPARPEAGASRRGRSRVGENPSA